MPFPWKKLFPDISFLRIKRSKKNIRTQSTLGESDIEGDTSARPAGSNTLRIQSTLRITSDVAQTVLPGVVAVAGVIPVAGPPLQAAISGLMFILQGIDRNLQNKQDIAGLKLRLEALRRCLDNAPITTDPDEQYRRDFLTRVLEETSSKLANMNKRFGYVARATQVIAGCSNDINSYLLLYSVSSQMQAGAILATLQSNQSPGTFTLRCVTLVDATGDEHPIQMEFCHSFEQLSAILQAIFKVDSNRAQIQRRYLEAGQYNLSIDRYTEVTQLTSNFWPTIDAGTKIIMSIVVKQPDPMTMAYQCYSCKAWNTVSSTNKSQISLIDCAGCGQRFQTSTNSKELKQAINMTNSELSPVGATAADNQLIRNWHLEYEEKAKELERMSSKWAAPPWLVEALSGLQEHYPDDKFEAILRRPSPRASPEWRMKCLDCPGKLYNSGPGDTLQNYEVHLRNRQHRLRVNARLTQAPVS